MLFDIRCGLRTMGALPPLFRAWWYMVNYYRQVESYYLLDGGYQWLSTFFF